jgi:hypothetical protein
MFDLLKVAIDKILDAKQLFIMFCAASGSFLLHSLAETNIETPLSIAESGIIYFAFFCLSGFLGHGLVCIGKNIAGIFLIIGKCIQDKHYSKRRERKNIELEIQREQEKDSNTKILQNKLQERLLTSMPHMDEDNLYILFSLTKLESFAYKETYELQQLIKIKYIILIDRLPNDDIIISLNPILKKTISNYLEKLSAQLIKKEEEKWGKEAIQRTISLFKKEYHSDIDIFEMSVLDESSLFTGTYSQAEKNWTLNNIVFWNLTLNTPTHYYETINKLPKSKDHQTTPQL